MKTIFKLLLVLIALGSLTLGASAQINANISIGLGGAHPTYLHALSDLRAARWHLQRGHVGPNDHFAIEEIDKAIGEIKQAAIDDGKNPDDHPPVDASLDEHGRFHRALELLAHAHRDIDEHEDDVFAQGLKHRALHHIDEARRLIKEILDNW